MKRPPQPSVSKHLRVLRNAGFVEARIEAQRRVYRLRPEPLQEVDLWLEPFRRLWTAHIDALERHLDRLAKAKAQTKPMRAPSTAANDAQPPRKITASRRQRREDR